MYCKSGRLQVRLDVEIASKPNGFGVQYAQRLWYLLTGHWFRPKAVQPPMDGPHHREPIGDGREANQSSILLIRVRFRVRIWP